MSTVPLTTHPVIVAPSLLAGDHAALYQSLKEIENAALPWVHLDIMDGHFVPNLSFGPQTLAALRPRTGLFFDTHLMLDNPHRYVDAFAGAGAQSITIHIEPDYPHLETLKKIRALGLRAGIALNPDTPPERVRALLPHVDLVLAMTVHPGFGGQAFISHVLEKVRTLAAWRRQEGHAYRIEVDGGLTTQTARESLAAGVDTLVVGTAFFGATDKAGWLKTLN